MLKPIAVMTASLLLSACASVSVQDYAQRQPKLDPRQFFDGKLCADGVVRDWKGEQIRQFNARILASWDADGVGTLDEVFQFDDGIETRIWTLTPITNSDGQRAYRAEASDVPEATVMNFAGNAIHMNYLLRYGQPGDTIDLTMDDWMFKVADGVVVNETTMSKWGFDVGQVLLVMRKVDDGHECIVK